MMYVLILEGINKAIAEGKKVYFITLTSGKHFRHSIVDSFYKLLSAINEYNGVPLEYFVMFTNELNGVVHCLMVDCPVPLEWIENNWVKIHGAYIVRKSEVYSPVGIAVYLVTQREVFDFEFSGGWI